MMAMFTKLLAIRSEAKKCRGRCMMVWISLSFLSSLSWSLVRSEGLNEKKATSLPDIKPLIKSRMIIRMIMPRNSVNGTNKISPSSAKFGGGSSVGSMLAKSSIVTCLITRPSLKDVLVFQDSFNESWNW